MGAALPALVRIPLLRFGMLDQATSCIHFEDTRDDCSRCAGVPTDRASRSTGRDGCAKLWDAETGRVAFTLLDDTPWIVSSAWSPDGSKLAAGAGNASFHVWDATLGYQRHGAHQKPAR